MIAPVPSGTSQDTGTAREWIPPVFLASLVVGTTFVVDGAVTDAYETPKTWLVTLVVTAAAVSWAAAGLWRRASVRLSLVDALLAGALLFRLAAHPGLVDRADATVLPYGAALVGLTFLTRQFLSPRHRVDLLLVVAVNGTLLALPGLRHALVAWGGGAGSSPLVGTLGTVNGYGAVVALGALAAWVSASITDGAAARRLLRVAAGACVLALLANGSRGGLLGLLTGGGAALVLRRRRSGDGDATATRRPWRTAGLAVVTLALTAGGLALLDPGSSGGRLLVWRMALPMIGDHPLAGIGPGRFGAEFPGYQAAFWADSGHQQWAHKASDLIHPHSDLLKAFTETGLVGGAFLMAAWTVALVALLRSSSRTTGARSASTGLLVLLLALLTHGAVDTVGLVVPVAVLGHAILGAAPAAATTWRPPRVAWAVILAVTVGAAGWVASTAATEYPGHEAWRDGRTASGIEAVAHLRDATRRLPGHALLDADLGRALLAADSIHDAVRVLEQAVTDGAPVAVRLTLAEAFLGQGDLAGAESEARAYLAVFPDRLRPRLTLARVALARGDEERAREELARCIRLETRARSSAVSAVAAEAAALWQASFDDPPPDLPAS